MIIQDNNIFEKAEQANNETYNKAMKRSFIGWIIAIIFIFFSFVSMITITVLIPLKEKIPYVVEVDKVSGETSVTKVTKGKLTQSESLTKYWINKYVRYRTQYDYQDIEESYELVKAMTSPREFTNYHKDYDTNNLESPYRIYGENTTLKTRIKSISFIDKDTATVRIDIEKKRINEDKPKHFPYIVTLSFRFTLEPESEKEIQENPFGFQCTKWRIDSEIEIGE